MNDDDFKAKLTAMQEMFASIRRAEADGTWTPEQIARARRATRIGMEMLKIQQRRPLRAAEMRRLTAARNDLIVDREEIQARLAELEKKL